MTDSRASPRLLLNELYSSGSFSSEEFPLLERVMRLRNEIIHGFAAPPVEPKLVMLVIDLTRRLMEESQLAEQSASSI